MSATATARRTPPVADESMISQVWKVSNAKNEIFDEARAKYGDTFGLNQDASPTNRGPVPFDAIAQVSVSIAPYDFRQSGFQAARSTPCCCLAPTISTAPAFIRRTPMA